MDKPRAPPVTQPPLSNLQGLVQELAFFNVPARSFLQPEYSDNASWSIMARQELMSLLRYPPLALVPEALDPQVLQVKDCGSFRRELISFRTSLGQRAEAYLLIPNGLSAPAPAVVTLHDHGLYYVSGKERLMALENEPAHLAEYKQLCYGGRAVAQELVERGFVVLAMDAFYWGSRRLKLSENEVLDSSLKLLLHAIAGIASHPLTPFLVQERTLASADLNAALFQKEELVARHIYAAGGTWLGLISHDDRRSVDLLCSRPEVDPDRLGCMGLSMGGMRTNLLFATDSRIRVACSAGWGTDWRHLLESNIASHSWAQYVPGLTGSLELSDLMSIGAAEGRAFLLQQCARDHLFPLTGMQATSARVEALWRKAGSSDRFRFKFYDVPHELSVMMQEDAFAWLLQWL